MPRVLTILLCLGGVASANGFLVRGSKPLPPIRLEIHRVTADVHDRIAKVTVEQVFRNTTGGTLEGTYLFPLPRDASVGEFAMTMGDRMVKGEVVDADAARRIYEDIVRRRRDPGLLEYVGRGLFRARVFPIGPDAELTIRLSYRQLLDEEDGTVAFRYPLATDTLNRAPVESVVVDVRFESTVALRSVYSPTHRIAVRRSGERDARVSFEAGGQRATRDLQVYFGRSAEEVGFTCLSTKPEGRDGTFLAVIAPPLAPAAEDIAPKDVVYLLDVSGSMQGTKIAQAKAALHQAVDLLRPGDRFDVVAFAADWVQLDPVLVPASDDNVERAHRWIASREAGGGTALEAALSRSLRMGEEGRLFLVVLITDGRPTVGITGAYDIQTQARKANRARGRIFTFGVGNDLDVLLLDRLAEATGGEREYIAEHERIDAVTKRFFQRVDQPLVTDVRLQLPPGLGQVYPRRLPDLFAGSQVVVMGKYTGPGEAKIRLVGRRGGGEFACEVRGRLAAADEAPYLERMWAHRKIAFLLDEIRLHGENKELTDEVIALATRHGIVTPYTAGLVLEERAPVASSTRGFSSSGGHGGAFRGPNGGVPPGLREPSDPSQAPSGPATPGAATAVSKDLKERKAETVEVTAGLVKTAADKSFRMDKSGRWLDTEWDGEGEPEAIKAFSKEYFDLLRKDDRIARYLAVGEKVVFLYEGQLYEVR